MFYGHYRIKQCGPGGLGGTVTVWEHNENLSISRDEQATNNLLLDPNFKVWEIVPSAYRMVIN